MHEQSEFSSVVASGGVHAVDPHAPTVISLFAGCGGSSMGYQLAGFRVCAAVEWELNAVETYRQNHPHTPIFHQDIQTLSVETLLSACGLSVGELDVLDGSPPCQGFSTAGKRQVSDPRNGLFREYVRLLSGLQPKVMVMENVSGLVKGKMKPIFVEILNALKACGYRVQAKLLNAQYYGVPQQRKRVIFIGVREDLGMIPTFPKPFSQPISFKAATADLPTPLDVLRPKGTALALARVIRPGEDGSDVRQRLGYPARDFSLQRLSWYKVAPTVCKTIRPGQCGLLHPQENRYLSTAELKRICSFPDAYQFVGSLEEHWARMGNSVPPRLMQAIAGHICTTLLAQGASNAEPS